MRDASICGLGQAAPNPLTCVLKYFPEELKTPLGQLVSSTATGETESMPMSTNGQADRKGKSITFTLDGREVEAREGETIWQAAQRLGIELPHLCYSPEPGYRADGNCRACMVEIEGERVLAASCIRKPAAGMKVKTATDRARTGAQDGVRAAGRRPARPRDARRTIPPRSSGRGPTAWSVAVGRFPRGHAADAPTAAIPPWRSISTPASTAICASAPAARCRSTT